MNGLTTWTQLTFDPLRCGSRPRQTSEKKMVPRKHRVTTNRNQVWAPSKEGEATSRQTRPKI